MALTSCGTPSKPGLDQPQVAPKHLPAALCAKPEPKPQMPADAGIPVAVTDQEKAVTDAFLNWVHGLGSWGDALADRADRTAASEACRG